MSAIVQEIWGGEVYGLSAFRCGSTPPDYDDRTTVSYVVHRRGQAKPVPLDPIKYLRDNGYMPIRPYQASGYTYSRELAEIYLERPISNGCKGWSRYSVDLRVDNPFTNDVPSFLTYSNWASAKSTAMRNASLAAMYDKMAAMEVGLGETLAEGRQTLDMVVQAAERLAAAGRDVRRGRFSSAARRLGLTRVPRGTSKSKGFASNWLAYRYGWMPVYLQVYGSMVVLFEHFRRPDIKMVNASVKDTLSASKGSNFDAGAYSLDSRKANYKVDSSMRWRVTHERTCTMYARSGCVVRFTDHYATTATSLGITDPLLVAWELVPLSFVADWFLNVGSVLGQFGAKIGKEILTTYQTWYWVSRDDNAAFVTAAPKQSLYPTCSYSTCRSTRSDYSVERQVFSNPQFVKFQFGNGLNTTRFFDALALLRQAFK